MKYSFLFSGRPAGAPKTCVARECPCGATATRSWSRRGFVAVDMLFGIIIVGGITVALLGTMRHERSAEAALADSRSALHLAEHALLNLQHGQPMPVPSKDQQLTILRITTGTAPAGFTWVKADAAVHHHRQSLLGVVPIESVPAEAKS